MSATAAARTPPLPFATASCARNIRAVYLGGVSYTGSTSPVFVQTVKQATPTGSVVAAPPSPIVSGTKPIILTATFSTTVTIGSLTPANVQFLIDGTNLGAPMALDPITHQASVHGHLEPADRQPRDQGQVPGQPQLPGRQHRRLQPGDHGPLTQHSTPGQDVPAVLTRLTGLARK